METIKFDNYDEPIAISVFADIAAKHGLSYRTVVEEYFRDLILRDEELTHYDAETLIDFLDHFLEDYAIEKGNAHGNAKSRLESLEYMKKEYFGFDQEKYKDYNEEENLGGMKNRF